MRRERATALIDGVLSAVCARQAGSALDLVVGVDVFGSYARGAAEPGDVDLNIEFDHERMLGRYNVYEYMDRRHEIAIKRALVGGSRSVNLIFQARTSSQAYPLPLTALWNECDDLGTARARLHSIVEDPTAGRAPRDHMLAAFEGVEHWLPVYLSQHICRGVEIGAITVEQTTISDCRVAEPDAASLIDRRWQVGEAANRVAHALLAHYEGRGVDPGTVHLQGRDVRDADTPYFAGFGCRYLSQVPHWFTDYAGREHIEIPRGPAKTADLLALRILAIAPKQFQTHGVFAWDIC